MGRAETPSTLMSLYERKAQSMYEGGERENFAPHFVRICAWECIKIRIEQTTNNKKLRI